MTYRETKLYILNQLAGLYEKAESNAIADVLIEQLSGDNNVDRSLNPDRNLDDSKIPELNQALARLKKNEPLQYITSTSWFCGFRFYVDKRVLIPRPETEELVEWIISNCKFPFESLKILDIGTGSGCIAVSLKRRLRKADVWAVDISEDALAVARKNADQLGADVKFLRLNILDPAATRGLPEFDIIVSNPPYIPKTEASTLDPNVLHYEPHLALFVEDPDPLLFYRAIAGFGKEHLAGNGSVYCELHADHGSAAKRIFEEAGYTSILKKDMQEKDRMLRSGLH